MDGRIVNGVAAGLSAGDKVGTGSGPKVDIVLTAIEGATICAKGSHNAISVVAATREGSFLPVPEGVYMEKLAVGPGLPAGVIDLTVSPEDNLINVAAAKGVAVADLTVCMLDRPRHADLLGRIYEAGARVVLIDDGDVSGAIAVALPQTGIDLYMGSGGAAEGVLAAAGLKCVGGQMQARLLLRGEDDRARARAAGLRDLQAVWGIDAMVRGEAMFAATGITDGTLLPGIRLRPPGVAFSHSLVMRSASGTVRTIAAQHDLTRHARVAQD